METKTCCKCQLSQSLSEFGKLKSSKDGLRYDCRSCRKLYRAQNKEHIQEKSKSYYAENKDKLVVINNERWHKNKDRYNAQRKVYRQRPEVKEHIRLKNKEYLPIKKEKIKLRRKTDLNFQLSEILRSKVHKMLAGKKTSYQHYIGCDLDWLKKWLEYRFDENMNWNNLGTYWHIDHVLPINRFDFTKEQDIKICFHWTNMQPLKKEENRDKSDTIYLYMYFNNLISITRFNVKYKQFLGYQNINESLCWLREELRYGKNPSDKVKIKLKTKMDNPQPSS